MLSLMHVSLTHVAPQLEWETLIPLACAAYNFIPYEHSKESPFFLMFGRGSCLTS